MKLKQFFLYTALSVSVPLSGAEAEELHLTLEDAISRARVSSVDAAVALDELKTSYWEYRSYRAELLPEVNFSATIPAYHRQYSPYMNGNGSYSFVRNNYLQMNGEVSLSQNIWLTGGKVSLNTSLDFFRQLDGEKYNRFMSIPVALTLSQPIFGVNNIKWNRRIEPVRYSEAKAAYLSASEEVAIKAISYYFQLLMADENRQIALQNLDNAKKLYEVAKEKRKIGRISGNDLLQMELNLLNAESELTECESSRKSSMFQLRTLLDINEDTYITLLPPTSTPKADITYEDALQKALERNKLAANIRRRQLEADYEVAKAKGNMRQISLFAQIGYTGTDRRFGGAYSTLKDNQVFVRVFGKEIIIRGFPMNLYLTADRKFKGYTGSGRDVRLHCTDNHPVICIASKSSLADMGYVFPNLQSADLHFCPAVIVVTVGQHIYLLRTTYSDGSTTTKKVAIK